MDKKKRWLPFEDFFLNLLDAMCDAAVELLVVFVTLSNGFFFANVI